MKPKVKICCISSVEEASTAVEYGAAALGLVGYMPSGPGVISDDLISEIVKTVPPPIATFLLTSETSPDAIVSHYKKVNSSVIQIVDALSERQYELLRKELPAVKLVQVIHVVDETSVTEAIEIAPYVDAILLDSGNPNLAVKELGGTGRTHNWALSRRIRESITIPLYLAGGLHKDNIKEAIDTVRPFGVDLCSGVRTHGKLDKEKLAAFFEALNS